MLTQNMKQKSLNTRQLKFVKLIAQGETQAQAHRRAGYRCPTIEGHGANAIRLLKNERIQLALKKLRDKSFEGMALSVAEKRAFLARAVRADASNPDPDLVQELVETHGENGSSKRVKLVSKLEAINIDNKMAGDNYADRQDQSQVNPFNFLVQFFSPSPGSPALPVPSPALPVSPVIEAEIVPTSTP